MPDLYSSQSVKKRLIRGRYCYILLAPVALYFIIFHFVPMFGIVIAFKDYNVFRGIFSSPWVGMKHFTKFFTSRQWGNIIWNSLVLNIISILFVFPAPIIFAILLNEVRNQVFKRAVQTITYLPHFISVVVLVSMMSGIFSLTNGLINQMLGRLGCDPINFLVSENWYRPLYTLSSIWQETGWSSVVYFGAISTIDPQLYEAARIDGAGRLKQILHVTLPGILSTIIIMLIMRTGTILTVGLEKSLLMSNSANRNVSRVLSTYIYEEGLGKSNYAYATAVNLVNSVVSLSVLAIVNTICKRTADISIW